MAESWLNAFQGQHITIVTLTGNEERTDTGRLITMGDGWLQMAKDNGEMILIPYSAVRIVKLLELTQTVPAVSRDVVTHSPTHPPERPL